MRLALILFIGAVLISATWAWSNSATGEAQGEPAVTDRPLLKRSKTTIKTTSIETARPAVAEPAPKLDAHATTLDAARQQARSTTGQGDPFKSLDATQPSPLNRTVPEMPAKVGTGQSASMVPPPPPSVANPFGDAPTKMPGQLDSGLNLGELPMPPDNAHFNARVDLVGIVGDRAIFSIKDNLLRRKHKWPKTFTLTLGQSFDGMKLIAVKDESAVVEEDGQTITKPMPVVR